MMDELTKKFIKALEACNHPDIHLVFPNIEEWLRGLYEFEEARGAPMWQRYYPTVHGRTLPQGLEKGVEFKEGVKPAMDILREEAKNLDNLSAEQHFHIGKITGDGHMVKIYGCLNPEKSVEFAQALAKWVKETGGANFDGKFFDLTSDGHNNLAGVVPFEDLPKLASFLADNKELFHEVEMNHPIGVQQYIIN